MVNMIGRWERIVRHLIIFASPGFVLLALDNLGGSLMENIMVCKHCLCFLYNVIGYGKNLFHLSFEHVVDAGVYEPVNDNALHARTRPPLFAGSETDRNYLPLFVICF
jgi:hypothetical protein